MILANNLHANFKTSAYFPSSWGCKINFKNYNDPCSKAQLAIVSYLMQCGSVLIIMETWRPRLNYAAQLQNSAIKLQYRRWRCSTFAILCHAAMTENGWSTPQSLNHLLTRQNWRQTHFLVYLPTACHRSYFQNALELCSITYLHPSGFA